MNTRPTTDEAPTFRDAVKAALWTFLWAFLGPFLLLLLDVVQSLAEWAESGGKTALPDLASFTYALMALVLAAAAGALNFLYRWAQSRGVPLPGAPARYDAGAPSHHVELAEGGSDTPDNLGDA